MSRLNGIQCDWCGATADLEGDRAFPKPGNVGPWSNIVHLACGRTEDLCDSCTKSADQALSKAKKRRKTGRVQR